MKPATAHTGMGGMMLGQKQRPISCDTFVALPPVTKPRNVVIFGKNSDRPAGEKQSIRKYPAKSCNDDENATVVKCTYLTIPQVPHTYGVLLSQIDWMWGAEMGTNDFGVVIGNEAVWTIEPEENDQPALLGMDLVRLGLERGKTAIEALHVMTTLLEEHGQGGACAENDPTFTYHNSFLIADCGGNAYVLETAGRNWVAQHINKHDGMKTRNISNGLTIRKDYDFHSSGLYEHARQRGLWKGGDDGEGKLDFAAVFSQSGVYDDMDKDPSRQGAGCRLLKFYTKDEGTLDAQAMMAILMDHEGGICVHGGFETTASMVSELSTDTDGRPRCRHWMTGKPHPCQSSFELQSMR